MEFSASYYKRNEKMNSLTVPSLSEASSSLGETVSNLLNETCPESLRKELSVDSKLQGPGQVLWISPSDALINNVVLKPPLTNKYMRALTHEGILEIGYKVEEHFVAEMEAQKKHMIHEEKHLMRFMAQREKAEAIEETKLSEHKKFQLELMQLHEEFEILLSEELTKLELYLKLMYEELLMEQVTDVLEREAIKTQDSIDETVGSTVQILTKKFLIELKNQEEQLTLLFEKKLEAQKSSYMELLENEQEVFQIILKQLQHNLQCNSIANFMYLLCTERRKCMFEQRNLVKMYEKQVSDLRIIGADLQTKLAQLHAEKELKERQCIIRETCLRSVICQFQKFINFALRATPTQAEFLLSVQKMMMFELAQAVAKVASRDKGHKVKQFMPWRRASRSTTASRKNLIAKDYHNCLKETVLPNLRESQQSLPYLHYNSRPYVREDFRNKISQGFFVRPSSMIWNKDVENLINLMKTSVTSFQPHETNRSSIHFTANNDNTETCTATIFNQDNNVGLLATHDSLTIQKNVSSVYAAIDGAAEIDGSDGNVGLLAASDSLTLARNTSTKGNLRRIDEEKTEQIENLKLEKGKSRTSIEEFDIEKKARESSFSRMSNDTMFLGFRKKTHGSKNSSTAESTKHHEHKGEPKPPLKSCSRKQIQKSISNDDKLDYVESSTFKPSNNFLLQQARSNTKTNSRTGHAAEINRPSDVEKHLKEYMQETELDEKVGHYVINTPGVEKTLNVNFMKVASVFENLVVPDKPEKIYRSKMQQIPSRDNYLQKPNEAKVLGIKQLDVNGTTRDFTINRIHSIVDMLKKDDDLIHIFTGCSQ